MELSASAHQPRGCAKDARMGLGDERTMGAGGPPSCVAAREELVDVVAAESQAGDPVWVFGRGVRFLHVIWVFVHDPVAPG